ncbi:hypothetical protein [Brevibacillus daliensis]|uniref:hypothetical protein n=1 Tax=Brevibacillus daliensis TaxID=2892995 RepID=UPI001E589658|nr:hypothetical protein [Brevibacillus daliensis]
MKPTANLSVMIVGILGSAKLIAEAFGLEVISNEQINLIANGVAAAATVLATTWNQIRKKTEQTKVL